MTITLAMKGEFHILHIFHIFTHISHIYTFSSYRKEYNPSYFEDQPVNKI